jgi:crossover junction endodeoxyribonuclease RuvC
MEAGSSLTVLGIDPGTAATGYGVVTAQGQAVSAVCGGVITTAADVPLERRLGAIFEQIGVLLDDHRPQAIAVEDIFFGRNVRTAFAVGQARGVVLGAAGLRDVPCFTYTPQAIKLAVCGAGQAPKDQVQRMVAALLGLDGPPEPDHAADALAVAICHAQRAAILDVTNREPDKGDKHAAKRHLDERLGKSHV